MVETEGSGIFKEPQPVAEGVIDGQLAQEDQSDLAIGGSPQFHRFKDGVELPISSPFLFELKSETEERDESENN